MITVVTQISHAARLHLPEHFAKHPQQGIGIFRREVQAVWPWVRPYCDKRAVNAAKQLGLPTDPDKLGALAPRDNAHLAAALVRVSLDDDLRNPNQRTEQIGEDRVETVGELDSMRSAKSLGIGAGAIVPGREAERVAFALHRPDKGPSPPTYPDYCRTDHASLPA